MKILALESSAVAASAAICEDEALIAQHFLHAGLTHSQTLLPMAEGLLRECGLTLRDMDLIAVAAGPGSFTGLRIGVSTAKGLAWVHETPCAACGTLESMAWNAVGLAGELCTAMDARRGQVYGARFSSDGRTITRLSADRALSVEELTGELAQSGARPFLLGDGAQLCARACEARGLSAQLAPENLRMQSAWGVARCGLALFQRGEAVSGRDLAPSYLRLSQAERERLEKEAQAQASAANKP